MQRWITLLAFITGAQISQLKTWVLAWKGKAGQDASERVLNPVYHSSPFTQLSQHTVYDTDVWVHHQYILLGV